MHTMTACALKQVYNRPKQVCRPAIAYFPCSLCMCRHPTGLPYDGNLDELDRVWTRSHLQGVTLQPVSLLVTLIHTVDEAFDLAHHWKLSNNEKRLGVFIVEHRKKTYSSDTSIKYYQVGAHNRPCVDLILYILY